MISPVESKTAKLRPSASTWLARRDAIAEART
jgi:hypothetical protein